MHYLADMMRILGMSSSFLLLFGHMYAMEQIVELDNLKKSLHYDSEIEIVIDMPEKSLIGELSNELQYQIIKQFLLLEDKDQRPKELNKLKCLNRSYRTLLCSYNSLPYEIKELLPYPYQPLTIKNMFAQFQQAKSFEDERRKTECTNFIKEHAIKALTPSWFYFVKRSFFYETAQNSVRIEQKVQDDIDQHIPQEMLIDPKYRYDLEEHLSNQRFFRHGLCLCFKVFCCMGLLDAIILSALFSE